VVRWSAGSTEELVTAAEPPHAPAQPAASNGSAATNRAPPLTRSALAFATRCHADQRRSSDGAPFIAHPLEVAGLLHDAGCSEVLVAAALLHDVAEDARVSLTELTARFGADVAQLVQAVTDDAFSPSYRYRKKVLREQVRGAGRTAALLFAAERISKVREFPDQVRHDRERFATAAPGSRARKRLERYHRMRLEHDEQSLRMLEELAAGDPLVTRLADELGRCLITIHRDAPGGPTAAGSRTVDTRLFTQ
jgi:hypothetical protein